MHRFLREFHRRPALLLMLVMISSLLVWMFHKDPDQPSMTAYLPMPDGLVWIGTTDGLKYLTPQGQLSSVSAFDGLEITALAVLKDSPYPFVATQTALWSRSPDGPWTMRLRGRVRQLTTLESDDELLVVLTAPLGRPETLALRSTDGISWFPDSVAQRTAISQPSLHPQASQTQ